MNNKIYVVGFGSGNFNQMTIQAQQAIENSDLVIGYTNYVEIVKKSYPDKTYLSTPMRQERERCLLAYEKAVEGYVVAFVCSGDAGVYGMAGLLLELQDRVPNGMNVEIEMIPGITAALSGGALLGAPLTHDFAVISLSDLLTPLDKIRKRLRLAAEADFVICLYNPSSKKRSDYLQAACEIILESASPDTVCGYVKNIGRDGQEMCVLPLRELQHVQVDMFTTVFIGNSQTKKRNGKMVTPRGYEL